MTQCHRHASYVPAMSTNHSLFTHIYVCMHWLVSFTLYKTILRVLEMSAIQPTYKKCHYQKTKQLLELVYHINCSYWITTGNYVLSQITFKNLKQWIRQKLQEIPESGNIVLEWRNIRTIISQAADENKGKYKAFT